MTLVAHLCKPVFCPGGARESECRKRRVGFPIPHCASHIDGENWLTDHQPNPTAAYYSRITYRRFDNSTPPTDEEYPGVLSTLDV